MDEKSQGLVTVFGGSGFLGRVIVETLAGRGIAVRLALRHPRSAPSGAASDPRTVNAVQADVRDEASVASAVQGASAVVNAVGLYHERGEETFEAVHVEGAGRVARQSSRAAVERLIHISGIGADPGSESRYVRARAAGEARVQEAFAAATIFRPSAMFGPGDALFGLLAQVAKRAPAIPLFGRGETRLQPVYVRDVAEAVARALEEPSSKGRIYELGGPQIYTYRGLVDLVLRHTGRKRPLVPVPFLLWEIQASLLRFLPEPPLTRDQVALMKRDNVAAAGTPGLNDLGVVPTPVEAVLASYIEPRRAPGRRRP